MLLAFLALLALLALVASLALIIAPLVLLPHRPLPSSVSAYASSYYASLSWPLPSPWW